VRAGYVDEVLWRTGGHFDHLHVSVPYGRRRSAGLAELFLDPPVGLRLG
jgi:hypothetical protein